MAYSYGDWNPTTPDARANGCKHDAAVRAFSKNFNFATDADPAAGTTNTLHVGRIRKGSMILPEFKLTSSADCSAINLSLGTSASSALYSAAAAGPNATTQTRDIKVATVGVVLTADTDLYLTTSGNWPATGTLTFTGFASHR